LFSIKFNILPAPKSLIWVVVFIVPMIRKNGFMKFKKYICIFGLFLLGLSCKKNNEGTSGGNPTAETGVKLSYGDSVFYLKNQSSDYIITPLNQSSGTYSAYPEGLDMNAATGAINVSQSETGLRYKIKFTSAGGPAKNDSTFIVLSGINYLDKFYYFAQNDTIVRPVYNADPAKPVPAGTYGLSGNSKLAINNANGQINLKKTIQNGLFSDDPQNSEWRKIKLDYKSTDNSASAKNRIEMVVYVYNTINDVPSNVSLLMRAHQPMVFGINQSLIPVTTAAPDLSVNNEVSISKPRPPCIVIILH
jgi:hypothetical protein